MNTHTAEVWFRAAVLATSIIVVFTSLWVVTPA